VHRPASSPAFLHQPGTPGATGHSAATSATTVVACSPHTADAAQVPRLPLPAHRTGRPEHYAVRAGDADGSWVCSRSLGAAGRWSELVVRLDDTDRLVHWRRLEPALADTDLDGVWGQLRPGVDAARSDELIGAVLRLAAVAGHDDPDAVLLLLHLLADGARALARQIRDLTAAPLSLVVGELAAQIRSFPVDRERRALAGALLLDTKKALIRELLPHRTRAHQDVQEIPVDPTDRANLAWLFHVQAPQDDGLDLIDLLLWAQQSGVVDPVDVALLLHAERSRDESGPLLLTLERCWGESGRTLRRRRLRTLSALQAARADYLRDCA